MPSEARGALQRANLGEDPFDPRQALILAAEAFLNWTLTEAEEHEEVEPEEDEADGLDSAGESLWGGWTESQQRSSPAIDMVYRGHRVAVVVASRHEASDTPVQYIWRRTWQEVREPLSGVCCAYVQPERSGEVTVLFEGWVEAREIGASEMERGPDGEVVIPLGLLRSMGALWQVLGKKPVAKPARGGVSELKRAAAEVAGQRVERPTRPVVFWRNIFVTAAAAAVLVVAILRWAPGGGVRPPAISNPVVDWQFSPEGLRGAAGGVPVVYNRQKYDIQVRVATARSHGWLFQIDGSGAYLLTLLKPEGSGVLAGSYTDRFDDRPGLEYFATVLADADLPALNEEQGPAKWLSAEQVAELSRLAGEQKNVDASALLRRAVEKAAPGTGGCDVRLMLIEHRKPK